MSDTPEYIYQKQYEIITAKSLPERLKLAFDTIDLTRQWVESVIRHNHPDISEVDLAVAVFLRYYHNDFPEVQLEKIVESIRLYHASLPTPNPN
jgi:hypothetical protein